MDENLKDIMPVLQKKDFVEMLGRKFCFVYLHFDLSLRNS